MKAEDSNRGAPPAEAATGSGAPGSRREGVAAEPSQAGVKSGPLARVWKSGWVIHAVRASIAAGASLESARLLRLEEAYWAPITTIVVMQSSLGAAWKISRQRFIGTALGAAAGGLLATWFAPRAVTFAAAVLLLGFICGLLGQDHPSFRFAGITLAIVFLVARTTRPYLIAVYRFTEVSLGIAVALAMTAIWPEDEKEGPD